MKRIAIVCLLVVLGIVYAGCGKTETPPAAQTASAIVVNANPNGPLAIQTPSAQFDILPGGYVQAYLVKDGRHVTLDEPAQGPASPGDSVTSGGKALGGVTLDLAHAKVGDARGNLGTRGKRVEVTGTGPEGIQKTLAVEVYDDFPNLAVTTWQYKNAGQADFKLDQVTVEQHTLNASLADPKAAPYAFWTFQGASFDWGKDEVLKLTKGFARPNVMGGPGPQGLGGGIPVVDFWTAGGGLAVGHIETVPLLVSMPVSVAKDDRAQVSVVFNPQIMLKPGETYTTPRTFVAVHTGDFYEPLHTWSAALQRGGWSIAKPDAADYAANWCGWGYEQDFTPAQMLATIPKLKEMNIKWATLDYRWFDSYGDWEPRKDTFPDDEIRKVVDEFHKQGIRMQLWWQPLSIEDGQGRHALPKPMTTAKLLAEHPDWVILDKDGKRARLISPVSTTAALCPALPEVQAYYKKLTERFIRDWGFDGNKMDSVYSVPPCYNPKHHHKSPEDSVRAVADVYRIILETTRSLKPDSVTQICPCGTTPNLAWLPYEDQAVTADPVGGFQVRRRIKMYKAILGPRAAIYGDHVELSEMHQQGQEWIESGRDFASTVGTGGVVGTKFTAPGETQPKFKRVILTPEKEKLWKQWIGIYDAKMLSTGTFLDLYTIGYDVPEGYAIRKDGKMYYAFFTPMITDHWKGEIELRGLDAGRYRVLDYVNGKDLGTVDQPSARLPAEFTGHLLLEVSKL